MQARDDEYTRRQFGKLVGCWLYHLASDHLAFFKDRRVAGKPNCLRVYIGIESFQGTKDSAYPSHRAIGERVGLGEEAVADAVKLLVEFGWVRATARPGRSCVS